MTGLLGIGLNLLIIGLLACTIYYAWKLSKALNNFKNHRQEMNALIAELNRSIKTAEKAMEHLRDTGIQTSSQLQEKISDAHKMNEELQLMNDLSDNLAQRLERQRGAQEAKKQVKPSRKKNTAQNEDDLPSFFIQDREFEDGDKTANMNEMDEGDDIEVPGNLQSEAEKELYKALQKNKTHH